ncbi:dethiobiotin synthase [Ruegeria sp. SCPT10]|uniref:dethiobiotin synthase n=1 Tax=Ruegeria sp. SCP10 TaxID=3141377 RepID=UPI0033355C6A
MSSLIVAGTGTGIGKTVFSAGLTRALSARYWKPVQSGLEDITDTETVTSLSGAETLPELYRLNKPASPHLSAEDMGVEIHLKHLKLPDIDGPLVVEGAGGIMVPLNRKHLFLDLFAQWRAPIVLVARTSLGTINHTLLSLQALRHVGCAVVGVAFVGEAEPDVEQTITEMGGVQHLGRLPYLDNLSRETLFEAFSAIDVATIRGFL